MNIVYLTPKPPYPTVSGSANIAFNHIRILSESHFVHLVSCDTNKNHDLGALKKWCASITTIPVLPRTRLRLNSLLGLISSRPLPVSHYAARPIRAAISRAVRRIRPEVMIFQLLEMAQFADAAPTASKILSMEDPLSLKNERWLPFERSAARRVVLAHEVVSLRRYEIEQARKFDRIVLINEPDARACEQILPNAKLDWAPYGVDSGEFSVANLDERQPGSIVITGTLNHPPNVDAILFFCREVLPLVWQELPDATLSLVGANPASKIADLADKRIRMVGTVPDMRPYLRSAMVSVCAVRLKIGTQTKVLEAMASGTPVVTTNAGNNGVQGVDGTHLYVADDPRMMAARVISLLRGTKWSMFSQNGLSYVRQCFDWNVGGRRFEEIIRAVAQQRTAQAVTHEQAA